LGLKRSKAIYELFALGHSPQHIALELETTVVTVYRHLRAKYGKRKPGRKKKVRPEQTNDQPPGDGRAEAGS
jgi:DNA invertase Pin-like site-specific DNA recombinase